jgi:hypothetical protein
MAPPTPPIVVSSDDFKPLSLQRSDTQKTFEDEVREVSQARMKLEPDDETGSRDLDFRRSKVEDLNDCVENETDRAELARSLGPKIAFEARNRCQDSFRQGLDDEGIEALEDGLKILTNNKLGEGSDHWRLSKVDLLLELGRDSEARDILKSRKRSFRGEHKPLLRQPSTNRRRSTINTDAEYEKML